MFSSLLNPICSVWTGFAFPICGIKYANTKCGNTKSGKNCHFSLWLVYIEPLRICKNFTENIIIPIFFVPSVSKEKYWLASEASRNLSQVFNKIMLEFDWNFLTSWDFGEEVSDNADLYEWLGATWNPSKGHMWPSSSRFEDPCANFFLNFFLIFDFWWWNTEFWHLWVGSLIIKIYKFRFSWFYIKKIFGCNMGNCCTRVQNF